MINHKMNEARSWDGLRRSKDEDTTVPTSFRGRPDSLELTYKGAQQSEIVMLICYDRGGSQGLTLCSSIASQHHRRIHSNLWVMVVERGGIFPIGSHLSTLHVRRRGLPKS
jgi:hypothetical protein